MNLKLITEYTPPEELIVEAISLSEGVSASIISGPFISYQRNRNKRIYLKEAVDREVERYIREMIEPKRAFGELEHPESTSINPDRVSHLVTELSDIGNVVQGKAMLLDTPSGRIARTLAEAGSIGISTRSVGNVNRRGEVTAFRLVCPDIVLNPSGIECFVDLVNESFEYYEEEGIIRPIASKKVLDRLPADQYRAAIVESFNGFFDVLKQD